MDKKIRILLVDDHAVVRESIRKLLEEQDGLEVVGEAGDGETAVSIACSLKPDVVVMDIAMPKLNGIEATKKIRKLCPNTCILILSAYDYTQYVFALLEAGANGYLLKDVSGQDLVSAIHNIHNGESVLCPTVASKVMQRFRQGANGDSSHHELTNRETEVLSMAAAGHKNKEIAKRIFVSNRTVEAHLASIFSKLKVSSRTEAILYALKKGLINLDDLDVNSDADC
jgi:DNA-binding NarL/FixJ family response regulator